MEVIMDIKKKLSEIQEEFSTHFPYIRLEFYGLGHTDQKIYSKKSQLLDTNKKLGEICILHRTTKLKVNGHMKVSTLEQNFNKAFGINVQVLRKSGNLWLQTTATNHWTLSKQNEKGREMENDTREEVINDFDQYHEQL